MIHYSTGNIFDSNALCLVNTVNCEGYMGKGIAYQFKEKFPENNKEYVRLCKMKSFSIGDILFFNEKGKIIANFPTKNFWRNKSEYSYIDSGLLSLKKGLIEKKIDSIAIPPLGCGNGGLNWDIVKEKIVSTFYNADIDVTIYEPSKKMSLRENSVQNISASHLVLMKLKQNITEGKFDKIRLQKAAFFMNVFSGKDFFIFDEYKFGPYSQSIEILSKQIKNFQENNNITTVEAEKLILRTIVSNSVIATLNMLNQSIMQATQFVNSIETNHELEIVATVVAIIKSFASLSEDEIVAYFFNEIPHRPKDSFSKKEVCSCIQNLVNSKIIMPELMGYILSDRIQNNASLDPIYQKK